MKRSSLIILTIIVVLLLDQVLKVWVKTNMTLGEEFSVIGDWFLIHFTENEGMAFGMTLGGGYGKLALSIFRIIAVMLIGYYLVFLSKTGAKMGLIFSVSLVFVGALGNIVDSVFYGMIFNQSSFHSVAEFLPEAGGYGGVLRGKVVDMFYFPLFYGSYPEWIPFKGGDSFIF
ncbi:MAG: lipoprotein signal peptidase, partial [Bacteroidota bacterium]